jgi:hypothetical protein
VQYEQYKTDNQSNMNESSGYMKREKSQQPKNNQDCGDNPKHFYLPISEIDSDGKLRAYLHGRWQLAASESQKASGSQADQHE